MRVAVMSVAKFGGGISCNARRGVRSTRVLGNYIEVLGESGEIWGSFRCIVLSE